MPNLAFHLEVLDQVIERLGTGSASDAKTAKLLKSNKKFAVLGALGPDMLRYMPISQHLSDFLFKLIPPATSGHQLTDAEIQAQTLVIENALQNLPADLESELALNPTGVAYSVLFRGLVVPAWAKLNQINDRLDKLEGIANGEDLTDIPDMISDLEAVMTAATSLQGLSSSAQLLQIILGATIAAGPLMEMGLGALPPNFDRRYEFLRWHHTGKFAEALTKGAATDAQKAFAVGWLSHVASSLAAEPFINNIVGGPYRTHWWRNRLVGNFVDSWTFGFFETSPGPKMQGDNPTPPYATWKPLCEGNLHDQFNVAGLAGPKTPDEIPEAVRAMATGNLGALPSQFPAEISNMLTDALNAVYPAATQPIAGLDVNGKSIGPAFTPTTFGQAFVGAFSVYWFMTSGSGPLGVNRIGSKPCMTEPSWIASAVSSGATPSPQQAGVNVDATVCAILLAIFGLAGLIPGDIAAGASVLIADTSAINWADVRCNLFWVRKRLVDLENALRDALVWTGFAYPPPMLLGAVDSNNNTLPATDLTPPATSAVGNTPAMMGVPLCKSNGQINTVAVINVFPARLDGRNMTADLNFAVFPAVGPEEPTTQNLIPPNQYPDFVVSGAGLQNGGIMTDGIYPSRSQFFGDAVSNAVQLIQANGKGLPNYNLDGDRGYGWKSWNPNPASNPSAPPIQDMQEP